MWDWITIKAFIESILYNSLWVTLEFVAIVVVGSMALGLWGSSLQQGFPGIRVFSTSMHSQWQ